MILKERKIKSYGKTSSGSIRRLKVWLKVLVSYSLFLNSNLCFAQFNSVEKTENPIQVNITIAEPVTTKQPRQNNDASASAEEVVEDLRKAPKTVDLTNLDKAEAVISSRMGAHLPVDKILLRSSFGYRVHPITKKYAFHTGIDISARLASIYAVLHGCVSRSSYNRKLGNYIVINHGNYTTIYGHLSQVFVREGDLVKPGEVIGISGKTGSTTGEHLHFTVKYKGGLIEPLVFLSTIMTANPNNLYLALFN